jgi:hypothetical protein
VSQPGSKLLGAFVVMLLASAADAWADGRQEEATRLTAGAWRLVGTSTFMDCDVPDERECGCGESASEGLRGPCG